MTRVIAVLVAIFFVASANDGPQEDAFAVVTQFKKAYDASDPPGMLSNRPAAVWDSTAGVDPCDGATRGISGVSR